MMLFNIEKLTVDNQQLTMGSNFVNCFLSTVN